MRKACSTLARCFQPCTAVPSLAGCMSMAASWHFRTFRGSNPSEGATVQRLPLVAREGRRLQPMAERLAPGNYDQLHHFIADGVWDAAPLEAELLVQADRLVGGKDAVLVIDDTAMPKKGDRSVGVAPQYASSLGKTANCQTLVSLTLARGEVPVMVALRLFVPESWTSNPVRLKRAGVPVEHRASRTKPEIALAEIDRVIASG